MFHPPRRHGRDISLTFPTRSQPTGTVRYALNDDDDEDENETENVVMEHDPPQQSPDNNVRRDNESSTNQSTQTSSTPSFPFVPAAIATLAFVLFWPLLALLRNYTYNIDVDMFMALKGILDDAGVVLPNDNDAEILELPPLSPAERLVNAIFGPP